MKLGPVTKIDKRNKTTSNNFDVDVMAENYDVMTNYDDIFFDFWPIWSNPKAGFRTHNLKKLCFQ